LFFPARFKGYKESKFNLHYKGGCTMKTKLPFIAVVAILVSACATGTYTAKTYDDDIYFSPGDVPPVALVENKAPVKEKSAQVTNPDTRNQRIVLSQLDKNDDGSNTLTNSVYQPGAENKNLDEQTYDMNNQDLVNSDTTVYYNDDDVKYVINNYYDDNDPDFAYRINRFYRPFYSPFFYDDWYYGYGGYGWGGYDPWYGGWGYGWGYPYYGYYSPFSFGWGGYWGGGFYGGGYFGCDYYGGGYYGGGYYGGGYWGGSYRDNNQVARRRTTNMNIAGGGINNTPNNSGRTSSQFGTNNTMQQNVQTTTGSTQNSWVENGHVRSRTIDASGNTQDTKNATIVNNRRPVTGTANSNTSGSQVQGRSDSRTQMVRPGSNTPANTRRSYEPSTTGSTYNQSRTARQTQNYTPSYNKPRIVNQSNFNNNTYTRPRTSGSNYDRPTVRSATSGSTYSQPRSSSSMRQTYRSSSTYSSGSSYSSPDRGSSIYERSSGSSGSSYSAPSRSSSSGSYSGGGGGGNSGGSSSGGSSSGGSSGGGSGHRR